MKRVTMAFTKFASAISRWTGRPLVFFTCVLLVIAWAVSGPLFKFSDTWQLVINTSTTIITFLMVFLIQNTQNRDSNAIHAKLDELIRVSEGQNGFIGIENLPDDELEAILAECDKHHTALRTIVKAEEVRRGHTAAKPKTAAKSKPASKTVAKTKPLAKPATPAKPANVNRPRRATAKA
jgi:low affinity Fe/Cu permease